MYNLIFKAYTLVLLKYIDTVQQIKRKLKFLSDKRGRNPVGYFFNRLRPPDRPGDKCTRKFLTSKCMSLKGSGWGPPGQEKIKTHTNRRFNLYFIIGLCRGVEGKLVLN